MVVHNTGWLPTYVTKQALKSKVVRGVIFEIDLPEGATLKSGKTRDDAGQLEGRAYTPPALTIWGSLGSTTDRVKYEWVIHAPHGGTVQVTARHERAGIIRESVPLGR
jgi:hypothetical protein